MAPSEPFPVFAELSSDWNRLCLAHVLGMAEGELIGALNAPESTLAQSGLVLAVLVLEAQDRGHLCLPANQALGFLKGLLAAMEPEHIDTEVPDRTDVFVSRLILALDHARSGKFANIVAQGIACQLWGTNTAQGTGLGPIEPFLMEYYSNTGGVQGGELVFFSNRQFSRDLILASALASRLDPQVVLPRPSRQDPGPEGWVPASASASSLVRQVCIDQGRAVEASRGRRLFVLSGGPGTGKTSTVFHILRAAWFDGLRRVGLSAPTGRAARRLRESLEATLASAQANQQLIPPAFASWLRSLEASTVHRFAGRGRPLGLSLGDLELLIVDEASMMDAELSSAILLGLDPLASLILVGDHRQLPSVDEGALMADLSRLARSKEDAPWFFRLTQSLRAGEGVLTIPRLLAYDESPRIIQTAIEVLPPFPAESDPDRIDKMVEGPVFLTRLHDTSREGAYGKNLEMRRQFTYNFSMAIHGVLSKACKSLAMVGDFNGKTGLADPVEAALAWSVLLSPVRKGLWGVDELNLELAGLWPGRQARSDAPRVQNLTVFEGMPLMVAANDQSLGIYNGERGLAHFDEAQGLWFLCFSLNRRVPLAQVADLEPSFAMTIHKSQGSEFANVHIALDGSSATCTRELLYTGLTRAKTRWHLLCSPGALAACLETPTERWSVLEAQIRAILLP